jgi:hypothetical protein
MARLLAALAVLGSLAIVQSAHAIHAAPAAPILSCGDPQTVFVPYGDEVGDHVGIDLYRQTRSHDSAAYSPLALVQQTRDAGLQPHGHAAFFETPQAKSVRYEARFVNALGQQSAPSPTSTCTSDIRWIAGAESVSTFGNAGEWAALSAGNSTRASRVTSPKAKGDFAYKCFLQEGDDSFGERCEYSQGNTSQSNIAVGKLYKEDETLWIAFAVYIPSPGFLWCGTQCSEDYDGGAVDQVKQLGSCGTPALAIPTYNYPDSRGLVLEQKNSATGGCESGTMLSLWRTSIEVNAWMKVLRRIHFKNNSTGWIETWADTDGDAATAWTPVPASLSGLNKQREIVQTELGPVERIYTHTQKSPTDHPSPACPDSAIDCSHQRVGVYRGGATANITGDSTIYHDSVVMGPTLQSVLDAGF